MKPYNHKAENVFEAMGFESKEESIKVLDKASKIMSKSDTYSGGCEQLEKSFTRRELAYIVTTVFHNHRQQNMEAALGAMLSKLESRAKTKK